MTEEGWKSTFLVIRNRNNGRLKLILIDNTPRAQAMRRCFRKFIETMENFQYIATLTFAEKTFYEKMWRWKVKYDDKLYLLYEMRDVFFKSTLKSIEQEGIKAFMGRQIRALKKLSTSLSFVDLEHKNFRKYKTVGYSLKRTTTNIKLQEVRPHYFVKHGKAYEVSQELVKKSHQKISEAQQYFKPLRKVQFSVIHKCSFCKKAPKFDIPFSYFMKYEKGKGGRIHVHMAFNLDYPNKVSRTNCVETYVGKLFSETFGRYGLIEIDKIRNHKQYGAYISKYYSKKKCDPSFSYKEKRYITSLNLEVKKEYSKEWEFIAIAKEDEAADIVNHFTEHDHDLFLS